MSDWNKVISRLTNSPIHPVDDLLDLARRPVPGQATRDSRAGAGRDSLPDEAIWADTLPQDGVRLGVIVSAELEQPVLVAGQLAAMALERAVYPIIFSRIGHCGLERFGFRVEDSSAGSIYDSADLEEQLCRFWGIKMSIDIAQISALG